MAPGLSEGVPVRLTGLDYIEFFIKERVPLWKARIDDRCVQMVEAGLLQEVRSLRERGYGPELPCMRAIGYRHMQPVIDGADTMVNVLTEMQRDTRHFARRQRTWLRSLRDAVWMHPDDEDGLQKTVEDFLRLSSPSTYS